MSDRLAWWTDCSGPCDDKIDQFVAVEF